MFIAIDVGGTHIRVASSKNLKTIQQIKRFPTPKNFNLAIGKITMAIKEIIQKQKVQKIIIGLPGVIDQKKGKLLTAPNLKNWVNKPLTNLLSKKFNCSVLLANDNDLAGLGEAIFGAGKKHQLIAYIAIGTGLGGTRIVNKQIDQSAYGFEPGHQIIQKNGKYWPHCQQKGCLESLISGRAFYKNYKIKPEKCQNKKILRDFAHLLGQGLVNTIVLWSPNIVIIGGGFAQRSHLFLKPLKEFVKKNLLIFKPPMIVKGNLGDQAGIYGGFHFLKTK